VEHQVETLVMQRVVDIALGYEDLNDHDELRHDLLLGGARRQAGGAATRLCAAGRQIRVEPAGTEPRRTDPLPQSQPRSGGIESLIVDLFLEAHDKAPERIILDLDATDDTLRGNQAGKFFRGYYDCYCYLPLYIFCGRHLLAAELRRSNAYAAAGSVEDVVRIVAQIRCRWPRTGILLRGDSGFSREALMA
jgi:Transposase DDE domain group 1